MKAEQIEKAKMIAAKETIKVMSKGATFEQALEIVFNDMNKRWPHAVAAMIQN